jgi:hypothetical protein
MPGARNQVEGCDRRLGLDFQKVDFRNVQTLSDPTKFPLKEVLAKEAFVSFLQNLLVIVIEGEEEGKRKLRCRLSWFEHCPLRSNFSE